MHWHASKMVIVALDIAVFTILHLINYNYNQIMTLWLLKLLKEGYFDHTLIYDIKLEILARSYLGVL